MKNNITEIIINSIFQLFVEIWAWIKRLPTIIFIFLILATYNLTKALFVKYYPADGDFTGLGEIGDFYGGLLSPPLNFLAFVAICYGLYQQRVEMKKQWKEFNTQSQIAEENVSLIDAQNDLLQEQNELTTKTIKLEQDKIHIQTIKTLLDDDKIRFHFSIIHRIENYSSESKKDDLNLTVTTFYNKFKAILNIWELLNIESQLLVAGLIQGRMDNDNIHNVFDNLFQEYDDNEKYKIMLSDYERLYNLSITHEIKKSTDNEKPDLVTTKDE